MADEQRANDGSMGDATSFDGLLRLQPPALNATPQDGTTSLYQGQKVALTVPTTGLSSAGYSSIAFQLYRKDDLKVLDSSKAGLVVHPDSAADVTQTVQTDSDTFVLNAVVLGQVSQNDFGYCRWNVDVTGANPDLALGGTHLSPSTDYGYGTLAVYANELYGVKQIEGNTITFDASKAIKIDNYQISDAGTKSAIETVKFSAFVEAKTGDLTYFDFWDSNETKLNKIQVDGKDKYVWIDSDDTGKFSFYITSNLSDGAYSDTLIMQTGNEARNIAQVVVTNPQGITPSANLAAPQPDQIAGSILTVPSSDSIVMVSIPPTFSQDAIQPGDMLIPCLGDGPPYTLLLNAFYVADGNASDGFPDCFAIPVSALNISESGEENQLQYFVVSGAQASMSSNLSFTAKGAPSNGPQPYPPQPRYLAPVMVGNEQCLDINFDMVEKGVTMKISWDSAGWAPIAGDQLTLYLFFNGWNGGVAVNQPQVIKLDPIGTQDLTNKYATCVVDYKYLAGFAEGPQGQQSTVFLQYQVPDDGTNRPGYSIATRTMNIDTVPPGGV